MPVITTPDFNHVYLTPEELEEIEDLDQFKRDFDESQLERDIDAHEWEPYYAEY